jgi:hypothetical protein
MSWAGNVTAYKGNGRTLKMFSKETSDRRSNTGSLEIDGRIICTFDKLEEYL